MDSFDDAIRQVRTETKQVGETIEKELKRRSDETEKIRRAEMRAVDTSLAEIRKELEQFPEIKRSLQARSDEEIAPGEADRRSAQPDRSRAPQR